MIYYNKKNWIRKSPLLMIRSTQLTAETVANSFVKQSFRWQFYRATEIQ